MRPLTLSPSRSAALGLALALVPTLASAQSTPPTPLTPKWLYEVSFGVGHRDSSGHLASPPAGAPDPADLRWTATVGLGGGVKQGRLSVLGTFDTTAGRQTGTGFWGGMGVYGLGRVEVTRWLWLEAGGGVAELSYRPPPQISVVTQGFWGPQVVGGAAWQLFRSNDIALSLMGRVTRATFDGLKVRTMSIQLAITGWR
jgi:hypothetical protein